MTTGHAVLEVQQLRLSYASQDRVVRAIEEATLVVGEGESVGLVGESGSGKSSLARAALGLLPEKTGRIEGGRIVIGGRDVTKATPREWESIRGNPVAMVFQDPLSFLNPVIRVDRQVAESVVHHDGEAKVGERIGELLELVKLPRNVARSYPHELSGGMRQRVLLAIALGCRPRLLIADEPTTALDVTTQAEILKLLAELRQRLDMGLLLISHDLALVASSCERVYVMYAGRTVEWGSSESVFKHPAHPYTVALVGAATAARTDDGRFITIEGDVPNLAERIEGCAFSPRCPRAVARCSTEVPTPFVAADAENHKARCWRIT